MLTAVGSGPSITSVGTEQTASRNEIAKALILSFSKIRDVRGYKDDRRHINADVAADLLLLNWHGQRNLNRDMVRRLAKAMKERGPEGGSNYAPNNIIALSYNPSQPQDYSKVALLNGQHTLHAIVASNTTQPLIVSLFPCRSREDIEFHYALFDQGRARLQRDVSRAAGLEDELRRRHLPVSAMGVLSSAAKAIRSGLEDTRDSGRDKLANAHVILEWLKESSAFYRIISPEPEAGVERPVMSETGKRLRKRLLSPALLSATLVALRSHPDETKATLLELIDAADNIEVAEQILAETVDYLIEAKISNGTDRNIARRNYVYLLVMLRDRARNKPVPESISDIIIEMAPTKKGMEELWYILTDDRLTRSGDYV